MAFTTTDTAPCTTIEKRAGCISSTLHILGDKWSPLLLGQMIEKPMTFSELELVLAGISPRTLSARLEKLVDQNIISKTPYCEHPPRYHYALTKKGSELQSILAAMGDWGYKYHNG